MFLTIWVSTYNEYCVKISCADSFSAVTNYLNESPLLIRRSKPGHFLRFTRSRCSISSATFPILSPILSRKDRFLIKTWSLPAIYQVALFHFQRNILHHFRGTVLPSFEQISSTTVLNFRQRTPFHPDYDLKNVVFRRSTITVVI